MLRPIVAASMPITDGAKASVGGRAAAAESKAVEAGAEVVNYSGGGMAGPATSFAKCFVPGSTMAAGAPVAQSRGGR